MPTPNQIQVTEGSGKSVGTETINNVDYGLVKIIDGKVGSTSVLSFVNNGTAIPVSMMGAISLNATSVFSATSILGTVPVTQTGIWNINSVIGAMPMYAQSADYVFGAPSVLTTTASIQILANPGGSLRNYVTNILVTNGGTVAATVNIVDVGQVIYSGYAAALGGGFSATLVTPLRQPTNGIGLYAASNAVTSIIVSASGYKAL